MKLSILSLSIITLAISVAAAPGPIATPAAVADIQARQDLGDSIQSELNGKLSSASDAAATRMESLSQAADSRSSSLSAAASSRSDSLDSALASRSSKYASITLNHPTQGLSTGGSACSSGADIEINGEHSCCDGPLINGKCYNLSLTINGGTQTPDAGSNSGLNSDSNDDKDGGLSLVAQPAAVLLGLIGGASFLLL